MIFKRKLFDKNVKRLCRFAACFLSEYEMCGILIYARIEMEMIINLYRIK